MLGKIAALWDNVPMLTHSAIWSAIDAVAEKHDLTPSGLARKAGLDPTTFNRSKRVSAGGKQRWPSTESIAKVVEATSTSMAEFMALLLESGGGGRVVERIPLLNLQEASLPGRFDARGLPNLSLPNPGLADSAAQGGAGWDRLPFPDLQDDLAYALEVSGETLLPAYRDGTVLVVSPRAETRRGDRVVVGRVSGGVICRTLQRKTLTRIELSGFGHAADELSLDVHDIAWMHRIIWATQ